MSALTEKELLEIDIKYTDVSDRDFLAIANKHRAGMIRKAKQEEIYERMLAQDESYQLFKRLRVEHGSVFY